VKRLFLLLVLCLPVAGSAAAATSAPGLGPPSELRVGFFDDQAFRWEPNRHANLDLARREGATIVRAFVDWGEVARTRPRHPRDPFDRAYHLDDLDELVRNAQQRGIDVLLTVWGTPSWANDGAGEAVAPTRPADLGDFAHALAARYSGRYSGLPVVRFFSVWNEPNSALFLRPQFDAAGRPVAPAEYARLVAAAYAGVKSASPTALVGAGETAPRGLDRHVAHFHDSESPGRFAQLVAAAAPHLRFDAWAHHPYPRNDLAAPDAPQPWPAVGLADLGAFERHLDRWFGRRRVPLWVTEFAYRTSPPVRGAASYGQQASYLLQAIALVRSDPDVAMFVWFGFRDAVGQRWESGLVDRSGRPKPALASFALGASCYRLALDPCTQLGPKLTGPGEGGAGAFGNAVALSGDGATALVGGPNDAGGAGASWVLVRTASSWTPQGPKLTVGDAVGDAHLGGSVALSADGDTALLGGSSDDGGAGAAWVFVRTGTGWSEQAKLTPLDETGNGGFGGRVALSADGQVALVGASGDGANSGAAWIFVRSGSSWVQQGARLQPSDASGRSQFGFRVALSADGGTALVAGWNDAAGRGSVWVFQRTGSGWEQQGPKLVPSDAVGVASFGSGLAVSADGNTALIGGEGDTGGTGAVWTFTRADGTWTQQGPKLTVAATAPGSSFGQSVALSSDGRVALLGAGRDGNGAGSAWVFAWTGAAWTQIAAKLTARDEQPPGFFGKTLALSADGGTALVGGYGDAGGAGAAWVFASWPGIATG
jgi:FG-GAP repeat/Glycosyl hydrolase catalytic core